MELPAHLPKFLLRWRFEWPNRPAKFGMWSHSGDVKDLATKAWCNNGENLAFAIVEAKNFVTREIKPVLICEGHNFRNFQWVANAFPSGRFSIGPKGIDFKIQNGTPMTRISGIKIVTRTEELMVLDCGKITRQPLTCGNINFATYGK